MLNTPEVHKEPRQANRGDRFEHFLGSIELLTEIAVFTSAVALAGVCDEESRCAIPGTRRLNVHGIFYHWILQDKGCTWLSARIASIE